MRLNCYDDFTPLKEVVVGSAEPEGDGEGPSALLETRLAEQLEDPSALIALRIHRSPSPEDQTSGVDRIASELPMEGALS